MDKDRKLICCTGEKKAAYCGQNCGEKRPSGLMPKKLYLLQFTFIAAQGNLDSVGTM